ncbi:hypothetical protein K458DRAFT_441624 [Lentithecium fluviatile CBS 122367]|uniref:Fungal N-terminal domain-containing protein n=1 Tax=Lentithecium fluviatile CBS 122367 TaxID=1168545 RepID=A0A6G1J9Y6_9PLEO|nr:hypothetical protein K458DRAFT_441624 [Lentithecium fluviatile CBS 122367]
MAEVAVVLAALQATTQLLEQAFRVLGRLRRAHQRQKALVDLLHRHETELKSVKTIIGIIDDEEDLQTASVVTEMCRLKDVQRRLVDLLEELDPKPSGKVKQFARQFAQGSADEKKLCGIMGELGHVKGDLLLRIQVANVGVMRTMGKQLVANAGVIQRIDQFLREEVGNCEGLRIARLLKGRRPSNDGTVPLTPADLKKLAEEDDGEDSADETLVDDSESPPLADPVKTERIILRNLARDQAFQINAALGKDIWKDINRLVIEDNVAENQAVQINHGTTFEAAKFMRAWQKETIVLVGQQASTLRRDSALAS